MQGGLPLFGQPKVIALPQAQQLFRNFQMAQNAMLLQQEEEEEKKFNPFKPHKLFEERRIGDWTEADVLQWWDHPIKGPQISEIHKEKYRPLLKANRINGATIANLEAESWLLLGIEDEGHINKIIASLAECTEPLVQNKVDEQASKTETKPQSEEAEKETLSGLEEEGSLVRNRKRKQIDETSTTTTTTTTQKEGKGKEKIRDDYDTDEKEKEKETVEERETKKARIEDVENVELGSGECPICIDSFPGEELARLNCSHIYCRDCLRTYLEMKIMSKEFPILCPNPKCGKEVTQTDVKALMPEEMVKKYETFSVTAVVEKNRDLYSCCPSLGCDYVFIWMKGDDPHFRCPKCRKHYCLNCQTDYHKNKSCLEFREWVYKNSLWYLMNKKADQLFQEHAMGKKYKKCPSCNFWTVKIEGCNNMTCSCGKHFCYACGTTECDGYSCPAQGEAMDDEEDESDREGDNDDY